MSEIDDLQVRIDKTIYEIRDIIQLLEERISDGVTFDQVKVIEDSIATHRRKGLLIPEELKRLKLQYVSKHEKFKEVNSLYNNFIRRINEITTSQNTKKVSKTKVAETKTNQSSYRKPPNYEKPLGSKGNRNLEDYLIPVIKLMLKGNDHREAFREVAKKLDVRYNTVSAQCTRTLGLTTDDFVNKVRTKTIVAFLENKYPDQYRMIKNSLKG